MPTDALGPDPTPAGFSPPEPQGGGREEIWGAGCVFLLKTTRKIAKIDQKRGSFDMPGTTKLDGSDVGKM
nr:MAG TPA: hypothetical protein [Caudoviricetes sp.]